jgi:hypothetical protein
MRKRMIAATEQDPSGGGQAWLDLPRLADVEITSEDPAHPIESALLPHGDSGWRAADPGPQTIRLVFASPQPIQRIRVEFVENAAQRTQQFVLRWSADRGKSFREIVRQQWNFSPPGATCETEDYRVDLPDATLVELTITPDIGGGDARASLARLFLG